jgi:hypothetical protein
LEDFFKTGPLQGFMSKEPRTNEVFEFKHEMLGDLSMRSLRVPQQCDYKLWALALAHKLELGEV